ncbi:Hypothetical predicted protein, partial [Cloeon dipterum]
PQPPTPLGVSDTQPTAASGPEVVTTPVKDRLIIQQEQTPPPSTIFRPRMIRSLSAESDVNKLPLILFDQWIPDESDDSLEDYSAEIELLG